MYLHFYRSILLLFFIFFAMTSCSYFYQDSYVPAPANTLPQIKIDKILLDDFISQKTKIDMIAIGEKHLLLLDSGIFDIQHRSFVKTLNNLEDPSAKCLRLSAIKDGAVALYQSNDGNKHLQLLDVESHKWGNIQLPEVLNNADICNLLLISYDIQDFWILQKQDKNLRVLPYNSKSSSFEKPQIVASDLANTFDFNTTIRSSNSIFFLQTQDQQGPIAQLQILPQIKYTPALIDNVFYANVLSATYKDKFLFLAKTDTSQTGQLSLDLTTQTTSSKSLNIDPQCLTRQYSNIAFNGRHLMLLSNNKSCQSQIFDEQNQIWFALQSDKPVYQQFSQLSPVSKGFIFYAYNTELYLYHLRSQLWIKSKQILAADSATVVDNNALYSFDGISRQLLIWTFE